MSSVTIRKIEWRATYLRPVAMPSVECPVVKNWDTGLVGPDWLGISHCLACAHAVMIRADFEAASGEVHCGSD